MSRVEHTTFDGDADLVGVAPDAGQDVAGAGELYERLLSLRGRAIGAAQRAGDQSALVPSGWRLGAGNLTNYLAMRQVDLRDVQRRLATLGLSSLGRAEAHVLATIDAVLARLSGVAGLEAPADLGLRRPTFAEGDEQLERHATEALGPPPGGHATRVMVTLPSAAATDRELVSELIGAGMAVARVNCAHDGPDDWLAMARHVLDAAAEQGRPVRVAFDLPGPKLRIGPLEPGPEVVRLKPQRDAYGRMTERAVVRFVASDRVDGTAEGPPVLPLDPFIVSSAQVGDRIVLRDSRERQRSWRVERVEPGVVVATSDRTSYFRSHLPLHLARGGQVVVEGALGTLPATTPFIRLRRGDRLELRTGDRPGRPARMREDGAVEPASVSIPVAGVLDRLSPGDRVLLDDGSWTTVVREVSTGRAVVEVVQASSSKLRAEKGVNLPDTHLDIAAFTEDDADILRTVAPVADLVALSFVDAPGDIDRLHQALDELGATQVGVVLKIERRTAFEVLPALLLRSLRRPPVAVMVARGDLGVEIGFERLAEVQEEILWLCEAAHVPVIWATQVLETLAKDGARPTRAEVTDAAWAVRAECVMLNKGPHITEAIDVLDDILGRMRDHQEKRTPMLRPLTIAQLALGGEAASAT